MEPVEYSQTCDAAERLRFVVSGVVVGALAVGAGKFWFFPWLARFSATAPCRTVFGTNGATVLWFALFVGLPLLGAIVTGALYGRRGLRILRAEQFPSPGTRTLRPVRVIRGAAARRIGYLHLFAFVPFLVLAVWGYAQASAMPHDQDAFGKCAATGSQSEPQNRSGPDVPPHGLDS